MGTTAHWTCLGEQETLMMMTVAILPKSHQALIWTQPTWVDLQRPGRPQSRPQSSSY
jgi:hypothetical protein